LPTRCRRFRIGWREPPWGELKEITEAADLPEQRRVAVVAAYEWARPGRSLPPKAKVTFPALEMAVA